MDVLCVQEVFVSLIMVVELWGGRERDNEGVKNGSGLVTEAYMSCVVPWGWVLPTRAYIQMWAWHHWWVCFFDPQAPVISVLSHDREQIDWRAGREGKMRGVGSQDTFRNH